ncbi:MAG: phosphatidate cytidylyltransferase, partial [Aquincola sp.]|nr:phosphatidate cytidylyltransferase [Aquincola sp.]
MNMLRNLSVDQQVALLFVIVFGLLMLATAAVVGWSLRHPEASNGATGRHLKRDLRALWTGAVLFWLAWVWGALGATLLFGIVSFLALREFITLQHTRRSDHRSL